ncbi:LON peptidase substrate-binding domain-containing protein, partial [Klebsiella pneumoniae]|uniref:LON peptidase substrate-binding domain-containing protein n=1 Tax=Klebsiella pneumoniae TaxID=573 RepID=UPI001CD05F5A
MNPERSERIEIPVLPLRDVVVYPHMVIPLFVGREKSIRCLEAAMDHDKKIMLVAQKEASTDEPGVNDLFTVGTVALMNPLMILVKIIKLRWIHILSYDQMVSRKINNQTTRCANSIF